MSDSNSNGLAPRGDSAAIVKAVTVTQRAEMTRRMADVATRHAALKADLEAQRRAMDAEFHRRQAELDALIAPLKAELAKLTEVAWTVDLYLGRKEDLTLLRDGEPAPAETPITIRQRVLVMAEESLVLMDKKSTGMDADDIQAFVDWLLAAPENLDRVLPDQKGVVVLIPTKVLSNTGNIYEDVYKNEANRGSYWFLRNGEKLYLLTVDPELQIGDRVLPRRDEFVKVFEQTEFGITGRKPVEPGSDAWIKLEKAADARRRHFMRVMLVLQGVLDRTPAWQPLRPGGVNLLNVSAQDDGRVRIIQDDENTIQLTDGRESFREWQRRLNGLLRPGLRLIGNWHTEGFRELYVRREGRYEGHHPRITPDQIEGRPESDVPHLIEERRDGGFVIRFKRTDMIYKRNTPVPDEPGWIYKGEMPVEPSRRATCIVMPDDTWVLPYDLITVDEIRYYLASRDNRERAFLSMVPTLHAALAAKLAEAETERPFREHLERVLINDGAEPDEAPTLVEDLTHWWKVANAWSRPLNGDQKHEGKATRAILAEYQSRVRAAGSSTDHIVAAGRRIDGVIAVASNRQGQWFAYAPSLPAHNPGVFLDVTPISKSGKLGPVKAWQAIAQRSASLLTVAWSTPDWSTWNFAANPRHYLTGPQRDDLIGQILAMTVGLPLCVVDEFSPSKPEKRTLTVFAWVQGTPEDVETVASSSPLNWRSNTRDSRLIASTTYRVINGRDGLSLAPGWDSHDAFDRFSSGTKWGGTPWWPEDSYNYGDTRPRLAWSDESMLDRLKAYTDRCVAASAAERAAAQALETEAYRYVRPVMPLILAVRDGKLHDVFVEDFGHDAEDLWPAHLKSIVKGGDPIHSRDIWGLVATALKHGHPVAGQTLDQLAEFDLAHQKPDTWGRKSEPDLKGYGSIIVPEPEPDGE